MWEKRSTYGDEECSLRSSFISLAGIENGVLYLKFAEGFVLMPGPWWANPFKGRAYRSEEALVAIHLDNEIDEQNAVAVLIRGFSQAFGKPSGIFEKSISPEELFEDITEHPDKYEIKDVYASEGERAMLIRGSIHGEWKKVSSFRQEFDSEFELTIYQKDGAKMRYFWNDLDMDNPMDNW